MNRTHDPQARTWVPHAPDTHFPIQNLPFGIVADDGGGQRIAVRVGDFALDLPALADHGLIDPEWVPHSNVLDYMRIEHLPLIREALFDLLAAGNPRLRDDARVRERVLLPLERLRTMRPFSIGAFVDFYSSEYHASNVGRMFRPTMDPLLPNWKHLPVAYNGRASSVLPSGVPIVRPKGQTKPADSDLPVFGPTRELDYELEIGFFLGQENPYWRPISTDEAESFIFGLVLVNDWSARDIQRWEYQPLGPFLSKSFATTISDWVVTLDALEPWAVDGPKQDPEPLPYLRCTQPWHYDIHLEVSIQSARMTQPQVVTRTNYRHMYWNMAQQLAHATVNGTHVSEGDLYASGTISGPDPDSLGCMLELTWKGERPITLEETGETRVFLEDGDTVVMTGWCQGDGYRVGFGECRAKVVADRDALFKEFA